MDSKKSKTDEDDLDYLQAHGPAAKIIEINNLPFWWRLLTYTCFPVLSLLISTEMNLGNFVYDIIFAFFIISFFSCIPVILFFYTPKEMAMPILKITVSIIWIINIYNLLPGNIIENLHNFFEYVFYVILCLVAAIIVVWLIISPPDAPSAIKEKPDHLGWEGAQIVARELSNPAANGVWAGKTAHQDVFASIEDRGVVLGPPGSGKTAFLVSQLLKWAETKRSFVCLDSKPEIFGITGKDLARKGYKVLVYNPTSAHGHRYNPLVDVDGPEAIGELAAALIPSDDPENAVFNESARDLLDAMISHLQAVDGQASLVTIRSIIAGSDGYKGLLRTLGNSPDPDVVDIAQSLAMTAANERLLGSILGTLRANLRFLRYPNIRASLETSDFSLADLTSEQPVALFLQFEEHQRETTAHLLAAMAAHLMRYLIRHTARPPVLLLFDEVGTIPVIPGLIAKLNTIRSRNLPTWTYWQSLEQMQRYGAKADEGANLILGACDYQMVFRLNDNASAKWMSDRIGVVDVTVRSESAQPGWFGSVSSENASLVTEPKVFPHELQQLKGGQVVCTYRDLAWRGQATPYFEIWPQYQGKRPKGDQLFGDPYPETESDAA